MNFDRSIVDFAHARTALKYGLSSLGMSGTGGVLVPEYTCSALTQPIDKLGLTPEYYPVLDDFEPDWVALNKLVNREIHAIVMIHYFGQPQDIFRFQHFARKNNLFLIEDNAHGYKGSVEGRELGTFGDIGVSSPRKMLMLRTGGVLYLNGSRLVVSDKKLGRYPRWGLEEIISRSVKHFPVFRAAIQRKIRMRHDLSNPSAFRDKPVGDWRADPLDAREVEAVDWTVVKRERCANWESWIRFTSTHGLKPIWVQPKDGTCPWALPMYASGLEERNLWLQWGWGKNMNFFPWPSLPPSVIEMNGISVQRWKRLLCFPLDRGPQEFTFPRDLSKVHCSNFF